MMALSSNAPFFSLPHIETSPRRVRVFFGGLCLIDTTSAKLVWENKFYPIYFFDKDEMPKEFVRAVEEHTEKVLYDIDVGKKKASRSLILYLTGDLKGSFTISFNSMDQWFEEDEEIFVHPRDPYKRVDVLQSSRHVRMEINGVEVANTRAPRFLYETMVPVRTYVPKVHCRLDLLEPSDLRTQCPYKGEANYYNVNLPSREKFENIVWFYKAPLLECAAIKGYLAFYNEKVDTWIDGVKQERPVW